MLRKIVKNIRKMIYLYKRFFHTSIAKYRCATYIEPLKVNGKTKLTKNTFLGKNTNFNGMVIKGGGKVCIGDNFHSGEECLMIIQIHNYDFGQAIPYDDSYITQDIVIKDNVWVGDRVIILGGVIIEEGAIIQAGSVVVSDIPKCAIDGGHPAKVFKYRDIEHYDKLKKKGMFH